MSHDPLHPAAVDDGWRPGTADRPPVSTVGRVRTVVSAVLGTLGAVVLATAWLLGVTALHVLSPEHPGRTVVVALAVPELRHDVADSLVSDVEDRLDGLTPRQRGLLVSAVERVLAAPEVTARLSEAEVRGGEVDAAPFADAVADRLDAEAATGDARIDRLLPALADAVRESADDPPAAVGADLVPGLRDLRRFALGVALVLSVPGIVLAAAAVAVARSRGLALALVLSGSLALAALALAGAGGVLPEVVGELLGAVASVAGRGVVRGLALGAVLPVAAVVAHRAVRGHRESSTITS